MSEPYLRPISSTWWLQKRNYTLFMVRELTAVFIVAFLVFFLLWLAKLGQGAEVYSAFLQSLSSPGWILFNLVVLAAALYHTVTFFNAAGKAIVVHRGEEPLPPAFIVGPNYVAWVVVSVVILWIVLRS